VSSDTIMHESLIDDRDLAESMGGVHVAGFIGRERELALLDRMLRRVTAGGRAGRPGRALLIRGRRRVGKSRLAEGFVERAAAPYLFFTPSAPRTLPQDPPLFTQARTPSNLPRASLLAHPTPRPLHPPLP